MPSLPLTRGQSVLPWNLLNGQHPSISMCTQIWERKHKNMEAEETQSGAKAAVFQAYKRPLYTVSYFKYLGRMLTEDDDWEVVILNPRKVRKWWAQM